MADDLDRRIGVNVRRLRRARGLTQETLAERAGIGRHFLSDIETGRRRASVHTLVNLAQALDSGVDAILGTRSAPRGATGAEVDYLLLKPLWEELREVRPEYSRMIVRAARRMARDIKTLAPPSGRPLRAPRQQK